MQFENLRFSKFTRNVLKVVSGTALAQVIVLLSSPVIARLYGPEALGEQGLIISIATTLSVASSLSFPMAIVAARSDEEASALAFLALTVTTCFSIIFCVLLSINDNWALRVSNLEYISPFLLLIAFLSVLLTMNQSGIYALSRSGSFSISSISSVTSAFLASSTKILFGFFTPTSESMVFGNSVGYTVAPIVSIFYHRKLRSKQDRLTFTSLKNAFWKNRDFALFQTPRNLLSTLSLSLPTLALSSAHGAEIAGQYLLAVAVIFSPVVLVGSSFQTVFYPHISSLIRVEGRGFSALLKATLVLCFLGIIPFSTLMLYAPELFTFVFGSEWRVSAHLAQLLIPMVWSGLAILPTTSAIPILRLQRQFLVFEILLTALKALTLIWGIYYSETYTQMIAVFSIAVSLANILVVVWILIQARGR